MLCCTTSKHSAKTVEVRGIHRLPTLGKLVISPTNLICRQVCVRSHPSIAANVRVRVAGASHQFSTCQDSSKERVGTWLSNARDRFTNVAMGGVAVQCCSE